MPDLRDTLKTTPLTGTLTITPATEVSPLVLTGGTVTTSKPLVDATQTWNAAGEVFTGFNISITATAKAVNSKLFDVQASGVSRLAAIWDGGGYVIRTPYYIDAAIGFYLADGVNGQYGASGLKIINSAALAWVSGTNANLAHDTAIKRSAAAVLQVTDGSTGTGTFIFKFPTADPGIPGVWWDNAGVLTKSV